MASVWLAMEIEFRIFIFELTMETGVRLFWPSQGNIVIFD